MLFFKGKKILASLFEFLAAIFSTPSNWAPLEIQELLYYGYFGGSFGHLSL